MVSRATERAQQQLRSGLQQQRALCEASPSLRRDAPRTWLASSLTILHLSNTLPSASAGSRTHTSFPGRLAAMPAAASKIKVLFLPSPKATAAGLIAKE